jgi:hypothetical protein
LQDEFIRAREPYGACLAHELRERRSVSIGTARWLLVDRDVEAIVCREDRQSERLRFWRHDRCQTGELR